MKLFHKAKDGGPDSNVTGYWLIEWKRLFSVALLRFSNGSRDAYHSHAFNSISWLIWGRLLEYTLGENIPTFHQRWFKPIITKRETFHRVYSDGTSWVLTFRGPWNDTWQEKRPDGFVILTNGRKVVYEPSSN